MRIAVAQMNPVVGDLEGNLHNALEAVEAAQEVGAKLLIFGTGCVTGLPLGGLAAHEPFTEEAERHLRALAKASNILCLTTLPRAAGASAGAVTHELFLTSGRQANSLGVPTLEERNIPIIDLEGEGVLALPNGHFDASERFNDAMSIKQSVSVIVEMAADPCDAPEAAPAAHGTLERLRTLAVGNHAHVVYVGLAGAADDTVYGGGSVVINPAGELLHACTLTEQELLVFETREAAQETEDAAAAAGEGSDVTWAYLMGAVRDYVHKNGFTDVVVGLSGGIDSAVVAALAADALGAAHVHPVLMPGPYSSEGSVRDAEKLADNFKMEAVTLPITGAVTCLHEVLGEACGGAVEGLAAENLQARVRTVYLMTLSNAHGWMLLNTGNKSEAAMGFSTLYGDTAGAYAPLGDLYKTQVYELARWRAAQGPSIPPASIEKAPSAELYPDATDADRLPPYDLLDQILQAHVEGGEGAAALKARGFDAAVVDEVLRAVSRNEYKRRSEPIAPRLGGVSLTTQRAWPITNRWHDGASGTR